MSLLVTLFALGIVIFVHELGHMVAARRAGIGVLEFAIGMGPILKSKTVNETVYSLRWFPFGGFVKLAGMDDEDGAVVPDEINYRCKSVGARMLTIVAGAAMNVVLGFVLYCIVFSFWGVPQVSQSVHNVIPDTPAYGVGLQAGDTILSINGARITKTEHDLIPVINQSAGQTVILEIERQGVIQSISVIPESKDGGRGLIGVQFETDVIRYNVLEALRYSVYQTGSVITMVFKSLYVLISGQASFKEMAGPIGIVQMASFELDRGLLNFLYLMALISISLGVINMFPFPVLDGGHFLFLVIELIKGSPVNPKFERGAQYVGVSVLILLMVVIIFNDILNWKERVRLLEGLGL